MRSASELIITGTQISNNVAASDGGGVWTRNTNSNHLVNVLLAHNTVTNTGAAIYVYRGTVDIAHATIASPGLVLGAAIYITGTSSPQVNITNTIVTQHAIRIERAAAGIVSVTEDYNLFSGNTANLNGTIASGGHSLTGDPKFVAVLSDDYHPGVGSSAIDHGVNLGVPIDLDGRPRPIGAAPDIGADEWYPPLDKKVSLPLVIK